MSCRRCPLGALTLILLACAGPARAQTELSFTPLGNGFTGHPAVIRDDLVLETDGLYDAVRDYTDLSRPEWLGWHDHSPTFHFSQVLADGDLVVGLNADYGVGPIGFTVNDFSDPGAAYEASLVQSFAARTGWLGDDTLLLCGETIAAAYDLSDPAEPQFASALVLGFHAGNRQPTADGAILYLVDEGSRIRRLDVTEASHPVDLGSMDPVPGRIDGMVAMGGYLHLLLADEAPDGRTAVDLVTVDVQAPATPVVTFRQRLVMEEGARGTALAATGNLLMAATTGGGVRAFGLADPANPVAGWTLDHATDRIQVSASAIFIETEIELFVYEKGSHDRDPVRRIHRSVLPRFTQVVGDGPIQIAQLDAGQSVLIPVDASDPIQPRLLKPVDTGLSGLLHFADGLGVMHTRDDGVRILDLADPRDPRPLGLIPPHPGSVVAFSGDVLALRILEPTGQPGWWKVLLAIYDCRDPWQPVHVETIPENHIQFCDGQWLVCGHTDIRVYQLDEDKRPDLFATLVTEFAVVNAALVVADHLYLAGRDFLGENALEVHHLAPNPTLTDRKPLGLNPLQADRYRDHLFIQSYRECLVFDVSSPAQPRSIGSFAKEGGLGFAMNGETVTISGHLQTVLCGGYAPAGTPTPAIGGGVRMDPARPNPFNPVTNISFVTDEPRRLTAGVYDSRGRLVREIASRHFAPGAHTLTWDGRGGEAPVASGIYFVRIHGEGIETVQAVTLLK